MSAADDSPHQPHDKLFKLAFGDPETAAGLLHAELPPALATAMTLAQAYRQEGRLISLRENILEVLELRFESIPAGIGEAINELSDEAKLRQLHRHSMQCPTHESFAKEL